MKKAIVGLIIIVGFIIIFLVAALTLFYPAIKEEQSGLNATQVGNTQLSAVEQWGNNCNNYINGFSPEEQNIAFAYPGAEAFTHRGDPPCDHVYRAAFDDNNPSGCNQLDNKNAKAACIGASSTGITDTAVCNEFSGSHKEICWINVLLKDYKLSNISSKQDAENICNQINSQPLRSICLSYIVETSGDTNLCNFEGELKLICLEKYAKKNMTLPISSLQLLQGVNFCNSFFSNISDRIACYFAVTYNFQTFGNKTSYGDEKAGKMIFSDYSNLLGQTLILLQVRTDIQEGKITSYDSKYYYCDQIFGNLSEISSECTELKGNYCSIGISDGCNNNIPYWTYTI